MGRWMNMLTFSVSEYRKRLQMVKESMSRQGIDVLLVTDPANMNYLTGFDAWSFYVHQLLIVMIDEDEPIWIGRGIDASAAEITTWLHKDNIKIGRASCRERVGCAEHAETLKKRI